MAVTATVVAATVATASYVEAKDARSEQRAASERAAEQQRQARSVQEASNAQQAAMERRQQIREERVRRSRILQSAQNTGTASSSGEFGAIGGLSTTLSGNIGANLGALERGQQISAFNQTAADFGLQAQNAGIDAANAQSLFQLSTSIFASNISKTPAGTTKQGK